MNNFCYGSFSVFSPNKRNKWESRHKKMKHWHMANSSMKSEHTIYSSPNTFFPPDDFNIVSHIFMRLLFLWYVEKFNKYEGMATCKTSANRNYAQRIPRCRHLFSLSFARKTKIQLLCCSKNSIYHEQNIVKMPKSVC